VDKKIKATGPLYRFNISVSDVKIMSVSFL
jgi:hypothetical protein